MAIVVIFGICIVLIGVYMVHMTRTEIKDISKLSTYECGLSLKEKKIIEIYIKYFIIAILFIVFDIEISILYPVMLNIKTITYEGIIGIIVFIMILVKGLEIEIKSGTL